MGSEMCIRDSAIGAPCLIFGIWIILENVSLWPLSVVLVLYFSPFVFDRGRARTYDSAYKSVRNMQGLPSEAFGYFGNPYPLSPRAIRHTRFRLVTLSSRTPEHAEGLQAVIDSLEPYTVKIGWWDWTDWLNRQSQ